MRCAALLSLLLSCGLGAEDSPLVQAAKRSARGQPKSRIVITNETLRAAGGHVTTTAKQTPILLKTTPTNPTPPTKSEPVTPAPKPAAGVNSSAPPEPVEDAYIAEDTGLHADEIRDPGMFVRIPPEIAAQPQLAQPQVVPPTTPQYSRPQTKDAAQEKPPL